MMKITNFFFFCFIAFSSIQKPIGELIGSSIPILNRIAIPDLFGLLGLVFIIFSSKSHMSRGWALFEKKIYLSAFIFILCLVGSAFLGLNTGKSLSEVFILFFLMLITIGLVKNYSLNPHLFVKHICVGLIFATGISIYDLVASYTGLPRLFSTRASGEVLGGFRNAGQAGSYFLTMFIVIIPIRLTGLYEEFDRKTQKQIRLATVLSILMLILVGKVASYVAFVFAIVFYLLSKRNYKSLLYVTAAMLIMSAVVVQLETILPEVYNRLEYKVETRVVDRFTGNKDNDFILENWSKAMDAFVSYPVAGTGLGAFTGEFGSHEVHSTYLKILGETGLLGVFGYMVFMGSFLKLLIKRSVIRRSIHQVQAYFYALAPFYMGLLVGWMYTYHLRKREFWITVALVLVLHRFGRTFNNVGDNFKMK